jgi:hypothetical protein
VRVCRMVRDLLTASVQLALELYRDPEIDDAYLTLYARSTDYGPELRRAIRSMSAKRAPYVRGLSGHILVTSDFQQPIVDGL